MDMSLVTAAVGMMAANTQSQVATRVLKMKLDAQAQVLQLLAPAQSGQQRTGHRRQSGHVCVGSSVKRSA